MENISGSLWAAAGLVVGAIATGVVGWLGVMWDRAQKIQQVHTDQMIALEKMKVAKMLSDVAVKSVDQTMPNGTDREKKEAAAAIQANLYSAAKINMPANLTLPYNEASVNDQPSNSTTTVNTSTMTPGQPTVEEEMKIRTVNSDKV